MSLKIKHLAPYLPYKLNYLYKGKIKELVNLHYFYSHDEYGEIVGKTDCTRIFDPQFTEIQCRITAIKPILRQLSDLTKEIEVNGKKFIPIVELLKIKHKGWVIEKLNTRYNEIDFEINHNYAKAHFKFMASLSIEIWLKNLENQEYWIVEKLHEWHFDVFGLIQQNLAIDINTL